MIWRGVSDARIARIAERLARWGEQIVLVGLETEFLDALALSRSQRSWSSHGFAVDARAASDALKARAEKTDKADARALAEMLASGWYSAVHAKSLERHQLKALLGARDQLVRVKRQLYGQVRGLLRPFGIKISQRVGAKSFDEAVRMACNKEDVLYIAVGALLDTLANVASQIAVLDKQVRTLAQKRKACWHLMSAPGVGPITALAFTKRRSKIRIVLVRTGMLGPIWA